MVQEEVIASGASAQLANYPEILLPANALSLDSSGTRNPELPLVVADATIPIVRSQELSRGHDRRISWAIDPEILDSGLTNPRCFFTRAFRQQPVFSHANTAFLSIVRRLPQILRVEL